MRRIIEDLVNKRKQEQEQLKKKFAELGHLIENKSPFKRSKGQIKDKLLDVNEALERLITAQDKEWDAYNNNHSTMVFKSLEYKIDKLQAEYGNVRSILDNFITLEKSLQNLIASIDDKTASSKETSAELEEIKEQLSVYQYSDFEQRFRGSEEQVKEKLKNYLPIFSQTDHILDIGCGRGEFLELLQREGKTAEGIDISLSMLKKAQAKGLKCQKIDALEYLKKQKEACLGGIFSAQVIEHLNPDYLREMVTESHRVLKKDAPIVLETVNPLSLFALGNIYFLDVTHQRPLHPEYMRYLLESCGFADVDIVYTGELHQERLQEVSPEMPAAREFNGNVDKLNKLLFSAPAYAVTGVKR